MTAAPTQTFYEQIAANRRNSILLIAVVTFVLALLGFSIGYGTTGELAAAVPLTAGSMIFSGIVSGVSYLAGDGLVLSASRAHEVNWEANPRLVDVVRELSLAANVPVPKIYLIDDSAPNAFATGRSPKNASIAVTSGLLEKLDREELQGVIGHELAHVRNLDIRFAMLVAVLVGSVALLADMFLRGFFRGSRGGGGGRSRDGGGAIVLVFLILAVVLAILAPIFARLVQLAVSRQREYLADSSSVEITRNPAGLERALVKIAADKEPLEVANRATQHLYIVNPLKKNVVEASGLFSTHPPILHRINRLRSLSGEPPLDQLTAGALAGLE
jgi:heat shock protein HtpX